MQGNILVTLSLGILITSVVAVELRNLRSTTFFYLFHSILLFSIITAYAYLSKNTSLYLWSATCFLTKIILIPTLLFQFARRFPTREYRPVLGHGISVLAIGVLVVVFFRLFQSYSYLLAPGEAARTEPVRSLLAGAFTIFSLGLWALLTRRDVVKTVLGLALMENGVHLVLLALAPQLSETTMIGILTNVAAAVLILLYISSNIYQVFGSTDSAKLSELKR
ncbi:MAG: NADH-quinone oxidoreductase subunit K [candidate division KSB1 bacterium]|nr:NADH-quinone oxidoreductase subunit K [candidate division KSB1 bacterium]MDZ7293981.1 NADH-quinone oxidoreductase subunit K [candidate division KSB1 bacterium]MDZ7392770.1 NADH-quinone oxidoreductase subunit K [candidate division KSB1 bacterium]MDZ7413586.1 NADH-quinone oxidoreductase subunit K [candidate division KSB1 bacterium]